VAHFRRLGGSACGSKGTPLASGGRTASLTQERWRVRLSQHGSAGCPNIFNSSVSRVGSSAQFRSFRPSRARSGDIVNAHARLDPVAARLSLGYLHQPRSHPSSSLPRPAASNFTYIAVVGINCSAIPRCPITCTPTPALQPNKRSSKPFRNLQERPGRCKAESVGKAFSFQGGPEFVAHPTQNRSSRSQPDNQKDSGRPFSPSRVFSLAISNGSFQDFNLKFSPLGIPVAELGAAPGIIITSLLTPSGLRRNPPPHQTISPATPPPSPPFTLPRNNTLLRAPNKQQTSFLSPTRLLPLFSHLFALSAPPPRLVGHDYKPSFSHINSTATRELEH
jgi:hypothetical protein